MPHPISPLFTKADLGVADPDWSVLQTVPPSDRTGVMPDGDFNRVLFEFQQLNDDGRLPDEGTNASIRIVTWRALDDFITQISGQVIEPEHPLITPIEAIVLPGQSFTLSIGALDSPNDAANGLLVSWTPFRI